MIRDAYGQPPNSMAGWTTPNGSNYVSTCAGQDIIGGYLLFGRDAYANKTYTGLPGHTTVTVQFDAYLLDSWDGRPDSWSILIDGVERYNGTHKYAS